MKNMIKFFGVIALVAVIGFSMAGCKEDETDPTPQTVTYEGDAGGVRYTLKITENTARYTAQSGDSYELTVSTKKSTGTVEKNEGGTLTLKPSRGATTFTATVSSSGIDRMSGTITFDKEADGTLPAPETLTPPAPPVTGNNPFKGKWTGQLIDTVGGESHNTPFTITFADTTFEDSFTLFYGAIVKQKGTYTYTANTVTTKTTAVDYIYNGESETGGWVSSGERFDEFGINLTGTLSNGKLIFDDWGGEVTKTN